MAKKILTEKEVEKTFEIVRGFNLSDGSRYEAGNSFVYEKDFEPSDWKALLAMDAVKPVEKPESEAEKESIIYEVINGDS